MTLSIFYGTRTSLSCGDKLWISIRHFLVIFLTTIRHINIPLLSSKIKFMKQEIFTKYVDKVANLFGMTTEDMFKKTKDRNIVDARQLLYFLCHNRSMRIKFIQTQLAEMGHKINHSSIIYGISRVEKRMKEDYDYQRIVRQFESSVTI